MVTQDGTKPAGDVTLASGEQVNSIEKTYPQSVVDKMVRDAQSAVLADAGRAKKTAEEALARLTKLQEELQARELEAVKDDPAGIQRIKEKHQLKTTSEELDKARKELEEKNERLKNLELKEQEQSRQSKAQEIAGKYQVDPARLLEFTDGTPEKMEALAKVLPKTTEEKKPLKLGSNLPVGGKVTYEQLRDLYIKDPYDMDPTLKAEYFRLYNERHR